jgi:DNA adenine methylase
MEPVMKWAGGKRQILSLLKELLPPEALMGHTYYEPFVGGGSVLLSLAHTDAVVNDSNPELVNVYQQIKDNPNHIVELLQEHNARHCKNYYYEVRAWDRLPNYPDLPADVRAARTIYLNRTCFNGLYRVNRNGYFNVPIGSYVKPQIVREAQIREISNYLNNNNIQIICGDFENAVADIQPGDVVYFDPPYDYDDDCSEGFVRYTANQFSRDDLRRLAELCDNLVALGCYVLISNNDTECVQRYFPTDRYDHIHILGRRMINNLSTKRHGVNEVIIIGNQ